MVAWVNELRKKGVPGSSLMLQIEDVDVGAEYGVTEYSASWTWRQRFIQRYKMPLRTTTL